jgi:TRAP-type mannitol/chloroaromatic compound transport system permease small subunit
MKDGLLHNVANGFIKLATLMNAIATLWTFSIMFLMTGDVLGRFLFNHPITGTPELVRISLVGIVFMHMPHTLWVGRHVRSEIILSRISQKNRSALEGIMYIFAAAVFLGIVFSSWEPMIESWKIAEYEGEGALRVPVYPIRTIIIFGSIITFIFCFVRSLRYFFAIKNEKKRK